MSVSVALRIATITDAAVLAAHRVAMFREMGSVKPDCEQRLREASAAYFTLAILSGEYVGWVAHEPGSPAIVAGAGVQIRSMLPRPNATGHGLLFGREALVLNVYTQPDWRRRGIARLMMEAVTRWAATDGIVSLVLHASDDGRPLYETLGFIPTNEMRYTGPLTRDQHAT
jgi:GNAT superfamily N-acetyltransferase